MITLFTSRILAAKMEVFYAVLSEAATLASPHVFQPTFILFLSTINSVPFCFWSTSFPSSLRCPGYSNGTVIFDVFSFSLSHHCLVGPYLL